MEGKEYEILSEGTNDPSSFIEYAPLHEKLSGEPLTLRMWKAEARLARGEIKINSGADESLEGGRLALYPPEPDPLEQIAELKKRILAIERRRVSLMKADDPKSKVLLQDNVLKPNKSFNIWDYTLSSGDCVKRGQELQFVRIRGVILALTGNSQFLERFLFNIADQIDPCSKTADGSLCSQGRVKVDINPRIQTIHGSKTQLINGSLGGRIELDIDMRLECGILSGRSKIAANISKAAYIRDVHAPGLMINKIAFPEIGDHMLAIEGLCVEIYTAGPEKEEKRIFQ